jgi:uncharacterized membrane protein YfcA
MEINQIIILLIIGLIGGILSGLLGIGGAVFVILLLVLVLGFSQQTLKALPHDDDSAHWSLGRLAILQIGQRRSQSSRNFSSCFFYWRIFGGKLANHIPQEILKNFLPYF